MKKAAIILPPDNYDRIYVPRVRAALGEICDVVVEKIHPSRIPEFADTLSEVEILFTGWGAPRLDEDTLTYFPELELVLYGAGSLKSCVTDAFWERNIPICSSWVANAVPVAEFSFAQIILGLKQVLRMPELMRKARTKRFPVHFETCGAYGTTVALISLGQIGRMVAEHLKTLDVKVLAYDPFCAPETAEELGVELVSLADAFSRAQVVSLHTPWLKETENMITGDLLKRIPPGGTFINTARGAVVNEPEMIEVLRKRPDLTAVLDVTYPEPPDSESPLYDLTNVFLTPHIAGSIHGECGRMGEYAVEECRRWISGEPLNYQVSRAAFEKMA
ncbi:MAG: hydroxyacid dehydrogenase [Kiritimatiellia bacterium]